MSIAGTIAKNSIFNFIATASEMVAAFAAGIVLARTLGTEQYGLYSLMMWFLSLAFLVVNLGVGEMVKRFVAEALGQKNMSSAKGFVRLNLVVRGSATLLTSLLILALSGYLARLFNIPANNSIYFILIAGVFFPYVLASTFRAIFAGFQKYEYAAYLNLMISLMRAVLAIILVISGFGVKELLIMHIGVSVLGIFFGLFLLSRLLPLRDLILPSLLEPATRNIALKYSLAAMGILGVDYFLWQHAETMFLGIYGTVEEVGFYNIAHRIPAMAITLIPYVFGQVLLPAVSEQFGRGDMEKIKKIYITAARYLMMLSLPIAMAGIALARPIIHLLYGSDYAPTIVLMQIIFIPFSMRGLTHAVSSIIYGIKEPVFILKIGVILVCLSIGLNLWLIPKYGAIGAVIATSIPRMLSLPLYIGFVSRRIGAPWPLGDTIRVVLASVVMGLVVFVLQHYLGIVLGLCLGVTVGIIVYLAALLLLRLARPQDLTILKQLEPRLPFILRKGCAAIINLVERFVRK
jgi:O-antigen/teichoic acid export membrane protein